jgi:hypothetical protein
MFLEIAKEPSLYPVYVNKERTSIAGSVLIWSRVDQNSSERIKAETGLADLISLEQVICRLAQARNQDFINFVREREAWANELFQALADDDALTR